MPKERYISYLLKVLRKFNRYGVESTKINVNEKIIQESSEL